MSMPQVQDSAKPVEPIGDTAEFINRDMAPTRLDERTWGTRDIAALWVSMSACIPTYMLASSLIAEGMNWCSRSSWATRSCSCRWS